VEVADLTPTERRLRWAFPRGETVDFRQAPDEDPEQGGAWGPERTVRAEVLRTLMLSGQAAEGEVAALRVDGARITGPLDVRYGAVPNAVRLMGCHFEQAPSFYGAEIRQLNLSESYLPGLEAATIRCSGVLRLTDCRIPGQVRLGGARIAGALFMDRARLGSDGAGDERGQILHLNHSVIEDDVWAPGLVTNGSVRMHGAKISGMVNLEGASLSHPGETALDAQTLTVGSDLLARRLHAEGMVNLRGARIPGQIDLTRARLSNPGGTALRASSCTATEIWFRETEPIKGIVNFRRSQFDTLYATPEVWPDVVRLENLSYGTLAPPLPANQRLPLLEREEEGYAPHGYEQLAAAYRHIGDDAAARTVQLAKLRHHRRTLPWYLKTWGFLQDATVGYGFRPLRAAAWLVALLAVGSIVFGIQPPDVLKKGEAPDFNPFFYTLDLLLPIIDFGQEKAFKPQDGYQYLAYTLIIAGWVLATTIAAGITRAISRQ